MSTEAQADPANARHAGAGPSRVETRMSRLLTRIGGAVRENKKLVAVTVLCGLLQAAFTKAPLFLIKPVMDAFSVQPGEEVLFAGVSASMAAAGAWITELFGLGAVVGDSPGFHVLVASAAVLLATAIPGAIAIYGLLVLSRYFATKIVVDLRNEVGHHILQLPLRFFGRRRMGELISNITTDTTVLTRSFTLAVDHVIADPLLILANFVGVAYFVPEAIPVLLLMIPAMALPMVRMGGKVRRRTSKSLAAMGEATESMNQMLSGIRTVKAFQLEGQRLSEFEASNQEFLHRSTRMYKAKARGQSITFFGYQIGFSVLLLFLGWLVLSDSGYKFSNIAAAMALMATTYTHVKRLSRAYNVLMESTGALEGIESLLTEAVDPGVSNKGEPLESLRGDVCFENVEFSYGPNSNEPVIRGLSLNVTAGQVVALVGPSGGGKSTTLDLLARFHDPDAGRILIDGRDLKSLELKSFRKHVAIVSQQPFLFNASIRDNIMYGRPDATEAEMLEAARGAQVHDFVTTLPEGYETLAGERGTNLSGGQMQRITIARAILRNPEILILDEATSALDSESEELVQRALNTLMAGRTCFVIAHRLSTIQGANRIVVLDNGRIVESGTHAELMDLEGAYSRLRSLQSKLD